MHNQHPNIQDLNFDAQEISRREQVTEHFQLAYHGIALAIHEKRQTRAENVEQRMDRKNILYEGLGQAALGKVEYGSLEAKPQTFGERTMDARLDEKGLNQVRKSADQYRAELSLKRNQARMATTSQAKHQDIKSISKSSRQGELTAREARLAKLKVKAAPHDWTSKPHNKAKKQAEKSDKKLNRAIRQPIASRWRDLRKKRAINRAVKSDSKATFHGNKLIQLKNSSSERQALRKYYTAVENNEVMHGPEKP